ncbi:hypothetical protein HK097_005831 [Rhizophlyctis rosea]|uniref:DNA endonuclease activator Ctp1 C-terminal domain-containing protein n=1 Tax=Rhizophlyctis rosea TaxID=64517 RepID=A0AAD5X5E4_9FUNG|nr:hypothetical protein HK097_005831 [Rhizophlyctis rosea]
MDSYQPSVDFNKAICNLWDMHNAEMNKQRLENLNRQSCLEADITYLKAEIARAEAASRAAEHELRLQKEAAEKRAFSAEKKAERLERKVAEAKAETEMLRTQCIASIPLDKQITIMMQSHLVEISKLQAEVGKLKQTHGDEVVRLRATLDRQREQFLSLQKHLEEKSADWQNFRQKLVAKTVAKHIEDSTKKEKEKENEGRGRSEAVSSSGEYRRRKSGDMEDDLSSQSKRVKHAHGTDVDKAHSFGSRSVKSSKHSSPLQHKAQIPEGDTSLGGWSKNLPWMSPSKKDRASTPTGHRSDSEHKAQCPTGNHVDAHAVRHENQDVDMDVTRIEGGDSDILAQPDNVQPQVDAEPEPRKKKIFMPSSSLLDSPPQLPPPLNLAPSGLSLDKDEDPTPAPAKPTDPPVANEPFVPETPIHRERTAGHQSAPSDGSNTSRRSDGLRTVVATPASGSDAVGQGQAIKKRPSRTSLEPRGPKATGKRSSPHGSASGGAEKGDAPATTDVEDKPMLGSDDSVIIVGTNQGAAPADAVPRDSRNGRTTKKDDVGYKYQEVVRKKDERRKMHGEGCACCNDFYEAAGPVKPLPELGAPALQEDDHIQMVSRHRFWSKNPSTPPGYWSVDFPSTQEVAELNKQAKAKKQDSKNAK